MSTAVKLDVRPMPPKERHPRIFRLFDDLKPGETFELINDHDPKPLYYQFLHERAGQFQWNCLEEGPEVWRVDILKMTSGGPKPAAVAGGKAEWMDSLDPSGEVLLDVRPLIEQGEEPFQVILKTAKGLREGQHLRLVNSFEPVPLYAVLGRQGFDHSAEVKDGAWNIYFKKQAEKNGPRGDETRAATPDGDLFERFQAREPKISLDVRGLFPPEPMVQILEALPSIPPGGVLWVHHHREPVLLYEKLRERGYEGASRKLDDSNYTVLVWKREG